MESFYLSKGEFFKNTEKEMGKFEKGKSGNPKTQFQKGNRLQKPKGYEQVKTIMRRFLAADNPDNPLVSNSEAIVLAMIDKATNGDIAAANSLFDRIHGKPKTAMELSGDFAAHNLRYATAEELKMKIAAIDNELKEYGE